MTAFVIGALVLCALAGFMLWPVRRAAVAESNVEAPAHLAVLREQLAALDAEYAAGKLDAEQHRLARDELQRRVLEETAGDEAPLALRTSRTLRSLELRTRSWGRWKASCRQGSALRRSSHRHRSANIDRSPTLWGFLS